MNLYNLAFLAILGAGAVVAFFYLGGVDAVDEYLNDGGKSSQPAANSQTVPQPVQDAYPTPTAGPKGVWVPWEDELRATYIELYIQEAYPSRDVARCTWDMLRRHYTLDEVKTIMGAEVATDGFGSLVAAGGPYMEGESFSTCSE